jgi:undecaprenyl-diphosphatase
MELLQYIFLGLVQGITEWLPISSSGHLILFQEFFDISTPGLVFEIFLNFATLLALLIVFWKDLWELIKGFFRFTFAKSARTPENRNHFWFGLYIILGSIPVAVLGLLFGDYIETALKSVTTIAIALIVTGVALYAVSKLEGKRTQLKLADAIWVGILQAIALVPGISRSGVTLFGALSRNLERGLAIRYSFFLAIPVSLGTMLLKTGEIIEQFSGANFLNYSLAFIVALVSAIITLKWFLEIIRRGKLKYFTYYCVTVGVLVLLYQIIIL